MVKKLLNIFTNKMFNFFLIIPSYGSNINILSLSKKSDITYSHCYQFIKLLKINKIINIEKVGRQNNISLTSKGRLLKGYIESLYNFKFPFSQAFK